MDFKDTPAEAAFRAECREWLGANATRWPESSGNSLLSMLGREFGSEADLVRAREWQAKAATDGWAGISWPQEYGGRGATLVEQVIWSQEAAPFDVPDQLFGLGITLGGPTVIAHGTEEQKRRWLPPLLSGEEIWCQLFSEPGAGSDLASLRTAATRDGDEWVVNGQKVWTSGAHYSRWSMLITRTDPDVPKHKGITYFILDMDTPGIEVRPLKQMTGASHFSEVFLEDVRVPDTDRLGELNQGWGVAQTTLLNERGGLGALLGEIRSAHALADLARKASADGRPGIEDPRIRQQIANVYIQTEIIRFIAYRIVTAISQGRIPGAEASVAKLAMARFLNEAGSAAMGIGGPRSIAEANDWQHTLLAAPAVRIAGGSDEIQRNIIGERVLGLPKEPGVAKGTPFKDLPHS